MATRINTKFVITLTSIIVLLVLSMVFAFTFLKKSAADHVKLAEKAMQAANTALAQGDIEQHNTQCKRAATHFGSAKAKDATNTEYLYGFIKAHEQYICDNLTAAGNQLDEILAGAASIHNTPGATDQDRQTLYNLLTERARMQIITGRQHPISIMRSYANRRLDTAPEDSIASRYNAIGLSYMAEAKIDAQDIEEDLELLNDVASASPNDAQIQAALARYYFGNARRLFRVKGGAVDDEINASFAQSLKHIQQALALATKDPATFVEAADILFNMRAPDKALAKTLTALQHETALSLSQMALEKTVRDTLYIEEMASIINILAQATIPTGQGEAAYNGRERAIEIAQILVEENPKELGAYLALSNLQYEANQFEQANQTLEAGLAVDRLTNANEYIRDHRARLAMSSLLADIKCTLAIQANDNEERAKLLEKATAITDELDKTDTLPSQAKLVEARVNYLRGRIMLLQNKPRQAVQYLDRANQAYAGSNARTLRLLAQTHELLGTDKLATRFYETIIQNNLRPTTGDLLRLISLYLNPGESQQLDKAQLHLDQYRKARPEDMRAVRLQARLLTLQQKFDEAIAFLQTQDLVKHPDLAEMISNIRAMGGNAEGAIDLLRKRIADRPEGEPIEMQLVSRLLTLISDPKAKAAELDRLVALGLDEKIATIVKRTLSTGEVAIEDELALIDIQGGSEADQAMRRFLLYRRRGMNEEARPLLDKAIDLEPNRPDVIEWQYRLALTDKDWPAAEQAVQAMLKLDAAERPEVAVANGQFMRAQILAIQSNSLDEGATRNKQIREAILAYNKALESYNHYVDGWVQLGRLHYIQGNFFAAQNSLSEALDRQSRNVEALELMGLAEQASGNQPKALERFEQILAIQPGNRTALARFSSLAEQIGQVNRSIELREQIASLVSTNYDNRRALALLYAQSGQKQKAVQAIEAVIDAEGQTRPSIATLSRVLAIIGSADQAIQAIQRYLADLGGQAAWQDQLLLAQAYESAKKTKEADSAFGQAIELEKPEGTFNASLIRAQALLDRGQANQAAAIFDSLVQAFPDNDGLKQQAAELFLQLGKFAKAESFIKAVPESAQRYRLLIRLTSVQPSQLGRAIEIAKQATATYPNDFGLQLSLIELLRAEQDRKTQDARTYTKLLAMAKALTSDHPDRVEAQIALSDVLQAMGRADEAATALGKALVLAPRHIGANQRLYNVKLQEAESLAPTQLEASRGKAREALAIASDLLESQPNQPVLLRSAGQAAELADLKADAVNYYKKAFDISNDANDLAVYAISLLKTGQAGSARLVLEGDNATLVNSSLLLRSLRGRAIAESGRADVAKTLFTNLYKQAKTPNEQAIITQQVVLSFSDSDQAIQLIEQVMGDNLPLSIDSSLASLLMRQERYLEAAGRLKKYIASPASDPTTQFAVLAQLAQAYQMAGQVNEAKQAYDLAYKQMSEAAEQIPVGSKVQLLNNFAYLLADQMTGYNQEAIRYAEQALDLIPKGADDRRLALMEDTLGWAYFKSGQFDDAIRVLKQSVERFPLATNQLHLGRAYLATGNEADKDRSLLVLRRAVNQAKADDDKEMIVETEKWYNKAL